MSTLRSGATWAEVWCRTPMESCYVSIGSFSWGFFASLGEMRCCGPT